jgi:threonine/homoserine/homoserine lactone efflux protein
MDLHAWLVYLAASLALSLSPGPNGLLALTHGAMYGHRMTLATIAGGALGFVLLIALSMFGIGALLQASLVWLSVLKIAGGAYLVWLGIQLWRAPPVAASLTAALGTVSRGRLFRQGFLSAATNPKGILFFAAFLPQFIDPHRNLWLQFAVMAGTFAATEISYELLVAIAAQRVQRWLARVGRRFNQACGTVFALLGIGLALRD